jgi:hypothetical protein
MMRKKLDLLDVIIPIALGLFFIVLILSKIPLHFPYIVNFDEAVAVVLAYVTRQGYRLYEQVWHDHLSGLSLLLNAWFSFTGTSLYWARMLVLFLAALTLAIFYRLLRLQCSIPAAFLPTLLLSTASVWISLSTQMMRELPSLFFVVLSLYLLGIATRSTDRFKYLFYLLSALSFVFSLEIKLSGITVIPTFILIIFLQPKNPVLRRAIDIGIWLALITLCFLVASLTFFPFSYENIIQSHVKVSTDFTESGLTLFNLLQGAFFTEPMYLIIPLIAILGAFISRDIIPFIPPLVWLGSNLFRFASVSPIWPHYSIHLLFPALWIIGLFLDKLKISDLGREWKSPDRTSIRFLGTVLIIVLLVGQFLWNTLLLVSNRSAYAREYNRMAARYKPNPVETVLDRFKNSRKSLLTDNPHYIYKFALQTPPETVVITRKRLLAQNLNGNFILQVVQKRKPDLIFIDRFKKEFLESSALTEFLAKNYIEYPMKDTRGRLFLSPETWKELSRK